MEVKNYLLGYKDMYIFQDTKMFNFSLDSVLLPNFITLNSKIKKILDIGTGNAPIPLILSKKTSAFIEGVEIQEKACNLANKSVELNGLTNQIKIVNMDINDYYKNVESDTFDVITCNPPYFKLTKYSNINNLEAKVKARHEQSLSLEQVLKVSKKLLKNGGVLGLVNRPERLVEIILKMKEYNIEPKRLQLIYPFEGKEANILLIEGTKNGRPGLKILPPMYTHMANGEYTTTIKKYFEE